ncbi:PIN domain-containing protein (plasmid) [Streptomycetaceae bacterium NBC_01309]
MIIFDTNAVDLLRPDSLRADLIRKLRESGHHRVAVPWMVLEELVAHQAKPYILKHQSVTRGLDALRGVAPWEVDISLERLDLERIQGHWRSQYLKIFEVIETTGDAAKQALIREALALPPAKQGEKRAEGGRDAAIWFSILDFLVANPDEQICFVTNNHKDFGDGTFYPFPMDEDVSGMEGRLTRLKDFNEVVAKYTNEVSGEAAEAAAEELLRSAAVRGRVAQTAVEALDSPLGYVGLEMPDTETGWRSWLAAPEVALLSVNDVTGHEIEGDVWYTANVQWLLYGSALGNDDGTALGVACVWPMKVLFSTKETDESPTVLSDGDPTLPDTADDQCMKLLRRFKQNATQAARRATRGVARGTQNVSTWASSIAHPTAAAQILASMPKVDTSILEAQRRIAEQIAASMPKLDFSGNAAAQALTSIPKLDASFLVAQRGIAEQIAASMPKLDTSFLAAQRGIADQLAGVQGLSTTYLAAMRAAQAVSAGQSPSDDAEQPVSGDEDEDTE